MKKIIKTPKAPEPIGPYSQGVLAGNTLYISGQIAINPETGHVVMSDIKDETTQVMENLGAILSAAGMDFSNLVKCSIFLSDMNDFAEMNTVYGSYFKDQFPARETVQVSCLPKDMKVEISGVAYKGG
jgi:2-iminobutanoate/2-iminopropanoate deaminase